MSGERPGHRNADGVWIADPHPGHYDARGRWIRGPVMGYYDARGRWVATSAAQQRADARPYSGSRWTGARDDTRARSAWLDRRIRQSMADRSLSRSDGDYAVRSLSAIRRDDEDMRRDNGQLSQGEHIQILARLDDLSREINR